MKRKDEFNDLLLPIEEDKIQSAYEDITGSDSQGEEMVQEQPLYLQAAERRAARLGISADQLLAEYSRRLKESTYPTPTCLSTEEVQAYSLGADLTLEQQEHVADCESCLMLIDDSRPSEEILTTLMEGVRVLAVRVTASSPRSRTRTAAQLFRSPANSRCFSR
jgi:hypothetical protein